MKCIKVLVVDDHALFRRGVREALSTQENIEIVGEASDGLQTIDKAKELIPDVILMDLVMPRCGGITTTKVLHLELPQTNILILTDSEEEADLFAAIDAGARGYIIKDVNQQELIQAIKHTAKGGLIISPSMAAKLLTTFRAGKAPRRQAALA